MKKKLSQKYVKKILDLASNKTTSQMDSKKMSSIINKELERDKIFDSNGNLQTISYRNICRNLNEEIGHPIKIRKSFYLSTEQMKKRVEFCKQVLNRGIKFDQVMFIN